MKFTTLTLSVFLTLSGAVLLDETKYRLQLSSYNPVISKLASKLSTASVGDVLNSAIFQPLPAESFMESTPWYIKGFRWSENDPQDDTDNVWSPQSISTSADQGSYGGIVDNNSDVVAVSWNDQRNMTGSSSVSGNGVRVTFVRKGSADGIPKSRAYIHVLLVEPFDDNGKPNFRELANVISGGLVWRGNWLYITDNQLGLRVFDLTQIWRVAQGTSIGLSGSDYLGGAYPFVIPQAFTYKTVLPAKVTFEPASASLDRNSTPPCIVIGESTTPGENSTFAKFPLNNTSNLLASDSKNISTAVWAYQTNINHAEGITFARSSFWITSNDGEYINGDVFRWNPGSWADQFSGMLPPGVQGISYKPDGDELWIVGSTIGKRYVMALSASMKNGTGVDAGNDAGSGGGNSTAPSGSTVPAPTGNNNKLSSGAKAGIAVGVLAGVGGLLAGVMVLLKKRKKAAAQGHSCTDPAQPADSGWYMKPELSCEEQPKQGPRDISEVAELPTVPVRKEMQG
ncbi:hypothetical protein FN846DRAFT_69655 [Sphaerosporella brunnea]|uniref:Uncharacterized protein n=1 Tax=Sphaerosporella brunnea TaxID=1250544 RepID=A0A5J5EU20_9PEZI|nr:hypothetical protein FN846DRAFT_69655 [Sphaerosporella brunnea]